MHLFISVSMCFSKIKILSKRKCRIPVTLFPFSHWYFSSCLLVSSHPSFLKSSRMIQFSLLLLRCAVPCSKHLRWLWTQNRLGHLNFHLRRQRGKKLIGDWSVMYCYRQATTCTCQAAAGQRKLELCQKVYAPASKEKYLGSPLFQGKIGLFFEAHSHRFQVGNSWPSFLASKHDSLPCQPRAKSCHSCEELTCSLSASADKWLIYHSIIAISSSC